MHLFDLLLSVISVQEGDSAPNIPDLTAEENHSVYIFSWMKSVDSLLGKERRINLMIKYAQNCNYFVFYYIMIHYMVCLQVEPWCACGRAPCVQ